MWMLLRTTRFGKFDWDFLRRSNYKLRVDIMSNQIYDVKW